MEHHYRIMSVEVSVYEGLETGLYWVEVYDESRTMLHRKEIDDDAHSVDKLCDYINEYFVDNPRFENIVPAVMNTRTGLFVYRGYDKKPKEKQTAIMTGKPHGEPYSKPRSEPYGKPKGKPNALGYEVPCDEAEIRAVFGEPDIEQMGLG